MAGDPSSLCTSSHPSEGKIKKYPARQKHLMRLYQCVSDNGQRRSLQSQHELCSRQRC